jgi:ASC-1-like (ASCH) protein
MKFKQTLLSSLSFPFNNEFFYTAISFVIFALIYLGIFIFIKSQDWSTDKKHKHYVSIRNLLFFIFIISIVFIWSGEIKTFIVSATAILGATLIVFKEIILALVGSILTNKVFNVGDYIEYDGIQGKIIDRNFLNTRLLITSPFQSKELIFPNMHYITNKITNLSRFGKFQTYSLNIGVDKIEFVQDCSEQALAIAKNALSSHREKYEKHFNEQKREQLFFEAPEVDPKVTYDLHDAKSISFKLHYISHPLDQIAIEEEILKEYLKYVKKFLKENCKEEKDGN